MSQNESSSTQPVETPSDEKTQNQAKSDQNSSLQTSLNALKTLNFRNLYTASSYVDALDSYSTWRISKIQEINSEYATVNFDGWSHKWDEQIKLSGHKIAPFKKVTGPYTGGNKGAVRDFDFESSKESIQKVMEKLTNIANQNYQIGDAYILTQFLRGEWYIMMDSILSINQTFKSPSDLKIITDFIDTFWQAFIKYLDVLPSTLKQYIEGKATNNLLLHVIDEKIALASSWAELIDTVNKLFGGNARLKLFYSNDFSLKPFQTPFSIRPKEKFSTSNHNLMINSINTFASLGGFEKLINLLRWESKSTGSKTDKEIVYRFPMTYIRGILSAISPITHLLASAGRDKFAIDFKNAFFDRIDKLTIKDIKDNDPGIILGLIRDSLFIFEEFFGKEAYAFCEQQELECTLAILKSPFLEKKIRALSEFKDFFDRADPSFDVNDCLRQLGEKRKFRYWTNEKLKSWICSKKLLEFILGDQFHVETVKRSVIIMKFLSNNSALTHDHLDLLWKATTNAHEANLRVIYEVIIDLSSELNTDNLDFVYSKIKEIPYEKYDEMTINLLKEFTSNAQNTAIESAPTSYFSKAIRKAPKYEYYGLRLLWELIQDKSPLDPQFISQAFSALAVLIKHPNFKNEKDKLIVLCFENLKKGLSVPQSLMLSLHILSTYSGSGLFGLGSSLDEISSKFQKEYNLIDSVVEDCERYMREVANVYEKTTSKGGQIENRAAFIFVGKYSHSQNIDNRLLFLENLALQLKKGDFGLEHLKKLWNIFVKKSVTEVEKSVFLQWLTRSKETSTGKGKTYIIGEQLMKSFFINVFCDRIQMESYKNISPEVFRCFERYFEILNEREDLIELGKNTIKVIKYESLIGHEVLWSMLLNCQNEVVLRQVKNLIVNLHLKIATSSIEYKLGVWQNFINKVVDCLQLQNGNAIPTVISVLDSFVVNFDGKKYMNRENLANETINFIVVDKKDEKLKKSVDVPANGTLFLLRKKISQAFNYPLHDFDIYLNNNMKILAEIEEENGVSVIENIRDKDREKDIIINLRSSSATTSTLKERFKIMLADNQRIMDVLFELLSSNNSKVVNDIWEILSFLPINRSIKIMFEKLPIENDDSWNQLLDIKSPKKLLYCLKIVQDLMSDPTRDTWLKDFIKKRGFNHLQKLFLMIKESDLPSWFICKTASELLRLIYNFIDSKEQTLSQEQWSALAEKALRGLQIVLTSDYSKEMLEISQEKPENPAISYISSALTFMNKAIQTQPNFASMIYDNSNLSAILKKGLIESNDEALRAEFVSKITSLIEGMSKVEQQNSSQHAHSFFLSFLLKNLLEQAFSHRDRCKEFFQVAESIYTSSGESDLLASGVNFEELVNMLINNLLSLPPFETSTSDHDYLLQGLLSFLKLVFEKNPQIKAKISKDKPELLKEILYSCLFEIPNALTEIGEKPLPPKCKSSDSRKAAFELLEVLISNIDESTLHVTSILKAPLLKNFWRTSSNSDWYIVPLTSERSKIGYVGLKNLGCTCYMNSLMQQFFMISDFRNTVLQIEDPNFDKVEKHDNLLYQLQLIFCALKLSQRQYYDPRLFCHSYKDYEGNPINVLEQMDVDEFFNNIMDRLENLIKQTHYAEIIKRVFGGVLSNELICKGCPHYSEREEPFLAVSIQVKNKKNIMEGLQSFIQGEMLEGDNAYLCEKCDKKVPTLKRVCLKKLPNILILVLKRFEFDFDTMQKFKVNDFCEFPQKIDMQPYTQNYLKKKEQSKKEEGSSPSISDPDSEEFPPEYFDYNLRGVVIHMGTAESGHYYSLIKGENARWFEFNDNNVRPFDIKDLAQEAFGGEEKINIAGSSANTKQLREKCRNAYLLFYERDTYFDQNGKKLNNMLLGNETRDGSDRIDKISPNIVDAIKEDNYKFQMTKYIFDKDYGEFVYMLLRECEGKDYTKPTKSLFEACKFCTLFFMSVILRAQERSRLPPFLREIKSIFKKYRDICHWFVQNFAYKEILKEFLVSCTVKDMKYFVIGLLKTALKQCYSSCQSNEEFIESPLPQFLDSVFITMTEEREQIKSLDKLFELLSTYASLGEYSRQYMIKQKMIGRIIYYLFNEPAPVDIYGESLKDFSSGQSGNSELGQPTQLVGVRPNDLVKSFTEMLDMKKEKSIKESAITNYNHLVEAVSLLVLNCQTDLTEDEKNLFFKKLNILKVFMLQAQSKKARQLVSDMIAALQNGKEEFSKDILNICEKEIFKEDDASLKIYLQTIEKSMLIQDDFQKFRTERGMTIIMATIMSKEHRTYLRATEICLDYLYKVNKICSRNSIALRFCSENKAFFKIAETWIRENANPLNGLSAQTLKIFKKKNYTVIPTALQQNQSKFMSKAQDRLAKLKRVQKNESEELQSDYDSDEDFSEHAYQLGEKIDFMLIDGTWVSAIVINNLEDMIQIKLPNDNTPWIYSDADRMGPHLRVQAHTKNNVEYYKVG